MGGKPNPGTPKDNRLKQNQKNLAEANKAYGKSIPVDGPRKLPPASEGRNQLPPQFQKNKFPKKS